MTTILMYFIAIRNQHVLFIDIHIKYIWIFQGENNNIESII